MSIYRYNIDVVYSAISIYELFSNDGCYVNCFLKQLSLEVRKTCIRF
jgi:hypothetical protein